MARLAEALELLAAHPLIARERQDLTPPVRVHPCGPHVIIYVVEPDATVLVVRVRHGQEDWLGGPG